MSTTSTHIDNVMMNADGTMSITLTNWVNSAVALTFAGATISGVATNPTADTIVLAITVTPGSPLAQQATQDAGGSDNT